MMIFNRVGVGAGGGGQGFQMGTVRGQIRWVGGS